MKGNQVKKLRVKMKENPLQFMVILGCFVILAFLICGGVVYQSAKAKHLSKEQETILMEETGALREDMESEIKTLTMQLDEKSQNVLESEKRLDELTAQFEDKLDEKQVEQLSQTSEYLTQIEEIIRNSETMMKVIQETLQKNDENTTFLVKEQMEETKVLIDKMEAKIGDASNQIEDLLTDLEQQSKENEKKLTDEVKGAKDSLTDEVKGVKESLADEVKGGKEGLADEVKDTKESLTEEVKGAKESLADEVKDAKESLTEEVKGAKESLADEVKDTKESLTEEVKGAKESLAGEVKDARDTLIDGLKEVKESLTEEGEKQMAESVASMQKIVESHIRGLEEKLGEQYETIRSQIEANYKALDAGLDSLGADMKSQYGTLNSDINNQYGTINSNMESQYNAINSAIGSKYDLINSSMQNQYDTLATNLGGQYTTIKSDIHSGYESLEKLLAENQNAIQNTMNTQFTNLTNETNQYYQQVITDFGVGNDELQTYLEEKFGQVDGKMNQVFQSVSSGKSVLASALLTKGVDIPQDASFEQIKNGILSIPQTIYLGTETQNLPGTISFEYHHHIDADGNETGDVDIADSQGGCYTTTNYHQHTSECYETYSVTTYKTVPIEWSWTNSHTHGNSYTGVPDACRTCSYCGAHEIYGGHNDHVKSVPVVEIGKRLICAKSTEEPDNYSLGCGLSEGQIIGAHIVY